MELVASHRFLNKPLPFLRHVARDCGKLDASGAEPGPGLGVIYPGPEIHKAMREGLRTAADTLAKYPSTA